MRRELEPYSVAGRLLAGPACDGCAATWASPDDVPATWIGELFKSQRTKAAPARYRSEIKGAQVWPDIPDIGEGRCTRLDVAIDIWVTSGWEPPEPMPPDGRGQVPIEAFTLEPEHYTSKGGETWYAGAPSSDVRWRWYFYRYPERERPPIVLATWAAAGQADADGVISGADDDGGQRGWVPGSPGRVYRLEAQVRGDAAEKLYQAAREQGLAKAWADLVATRYQTAWPLPPMPVDPAPAVDIPEQYEPALDQLKANAVQYLRRQCTQYARKLGLAPKELEPILYAHLRRWLAVADPSEHAAEAPVFPRKHSRRKVWPPRD